MTQKSCYSVKNFAIFMGFGSFARQSGGVSVSMLGKHYEDSIMKISQRFL
jgi:hypothetical protein